jgi:hypothetical protein
VKLLAATAVLLPTTSAAQSRGGSCTSALCELTAVIVLAVLVLLFIGSVYDSVRAKGVIRGIITNRVALCVLSYSGVLVCVVGGSVAVEMLWGKYAAMWALGSLLLVLVLGPGLLRRLRSRVGAAPSKTGH